MTTSSRTTGPVTSEPLVCTLGVSSLSWSYEVIIQPWIRSFFENILEKTKKSKLKINILNEFQQIDFG